MSSIPPFLVTGRTLPEVWEKSVLKVWERGISIKTEYDKEDSPPSKDAIMMMQIDEPLAEPRLHRAFPGAVSDLEKYRLEVIDGVHDHWIKPEEEKWTYTYHERMTKYRVVEDLSNSAVKSPFAPVNQIEYIINELSETPYSRRAQAIIWMPTADPRTDHPPCMQRIWCRILENADMQLFLHMNTHWRSRDAYKAAFMNIYALTDLQRIIAEEISKKMGKEVKVGGYTDVSDSFHIYGAYFNEFQNFLKMQSRPFEERTWPTNDKKVQWHMKFARSELDSEKERGI